MAKVGRAVPLLGQALAQMSRRITTRLSLLLTVLAVAGCASIGPGTVPRDRLDYISAVGESWKEQTLH